MSPIIIPRPSQPWGYVVPRGSKTYPGPLNRRRFKGTPALWDIMGETPLFDYAFQETMSLTDLVTGQDDLLTFERNSDTSYIDSSGRVVFGGQDEMVFTHNPYTLEPLGLQIWGARTNRILQSANIGTSPWTIFNASYVAAPAEVNPTGGLGATFLRENTVNNFHAGFQPFDTGVNGIYGISAVVKADSRNWFQICTQLDGFTGSPFVNFDLANGTIGFSSGVANARIEPLFAGWYRCFASFTHNGTAVGSAPVFCILNGNTNARAPAYLGNGTGQVLWWHAQLEQGGRDMSPLITTTTVDETRQRDDIEFLDQPTAVQAQTLYAEGYVLSLVGPNVTRPLLGVNNGTNAERGELSVFGTNIRFTSSIGNASTILSGTGPEAVAADLVKIKIAARYVDGDMALCPNGGNVITATPAKSTLIDRFHFGKIGNSTALLNNSLARATCWAGAATDAQLQALTAP
jgi:hypothetical protein